MHIQFRVPDKLSLTLTVLQTTFGIFVTFELTERFGLYGQAMNIQLIDIHRVLQEERWCRLLELNLANIHQFDKLLFS